MADPANAEPSWIPLFPLPVVALPGDGLPLHIFEERYRVLMADLLRLKAEGLTPRFGICLFHEDRLFSAGTAALLDQVLQRYPDGRLDVLVHGVRRFHVLELRQDRPYREARIEFFDDEAGEPGPGPAVVQRVQSLCETYAGLVDLGSASTLALPDQALSFRIAGQVITDVLTRQSLLERTRESERLGYLIEYFERAIPRLRKLEDINNRVKTNGHFRVLPGSEESLQE